MRVVFSPDHARHAPEREFEKSQFQTPFEHPGRADIIYAALAADPAFAVVAPSAFGTGPIEAVHDPGLVQFLETAWEEYQVECGPTHDVVPDVFHHAALRAGMPGGRRPTSVAMLLGWWCYETTTPLTEGTYAAARASVDVALTATDAVLAGEPAAYGLCRPPGHHAARSVYGGYCFFNNAAVAAQHAVAAGAKVAVLDVDYHHGNGTQQIFYERPDVLYASVHADPVRAYPYVTGFADETGTGRGAGANLNLPLPPGVGDDDLLVAIDAALTAVSRFGADLLIVSLGLDMYGGDPIADMAISTDGFFASGALVAEAGLPTVAVQEGGYASDDLGRNAHAWLRGLAGPG